MSARTRRSLTLLWTALFLCSLALQSVQLASPVAALASPSDGVFQLDGDAVDNGAGVDWSNINAGSGGAQATTGILTDTVGRRFTQGSKDTLDMSSNSWDVASVPDKDDILHAFAALYDIGGNDTVVFGLDRYANNGDAHAGFWFFQDEISINANGSFSGHRTPGDVFIVSDFTSGGQLSTIKFYTWTANGLSSPTFGVACAPGSQTLCAISNTGNVAAPWSYTPKQGSAGTFPVASFFEGGINLDAIFRNGAPCFSTFMAETRSSTSETAELKNFVSGGFPTCDSPVIETHVQQGGQNVSKINKGESVVDVATFSGSDGAVTGTVDFFVCGPSSSKPDCANGGDPIGTNVAIASGSATSESFTPTALGWYCFRAEYTPAARASYLPGEHTNDTTECFKVIPADVQIVKTPNDGSASAGTPISFTLTWANEGEGSATGVVVTDNLPGAAGLDWGIQSSTGTGSLCAISGAVGSEKLTCTIGTIAGNPNFPDPAPSNGSVTVMSATFATSCGVIDNSGTITSANDGTDTDPGRITVLCPDVKVTKTPDGGTVNAGATATFTIKVENLGPGTATEVKLTDDLPAGYTWTLGGADADDCSINTAVNPDVLSCSFGTLAKDDSRTITLSAPTTGRNCAVIPNLAVVSASNEPTSANGNNSNAGDIDVLCAVIEIEKTANPAGPVSAGDEIGFDIVVRNTGDGTATDVDVTDTLPTDAGLAWTIESVTPPGAASCAIDAGVLTCTADTLAAGGSFTVHIVSDTTAATCGTVDNSASVTAGNDGQDSDGASVVVQCPDIEVEKTGNGTIDAGGNAVFTITVTNHGPGGAKDVELTDQLPDGDWTLGGADAAACDIDGDNLLTCDFGDVASGAARTITVTLTTTADDCGSIPNTVTVTATNEPSDDQFPNEDSDTVIVQCPDLTVEKTGNGPISAGQTAVFTITVTNLGPGAAADATLSDQLPAGDWTLGGADAAACDISATNLLTCDFETIEALDSRTITVSKTSDAGDCDSIPNDVTVSASNEADDDTANNDDHASIVVNCPDIQVVKTGNGPISAGDAATFTITLTNLGPGTAFDVTLTDELPAGVSWTLGGANAGQCTIDTSGDPDVLDCVFGQLASGASRTVTLSGETDAPDCGTIPNLASATASNESDEDLENNEDDASIVVDCPLIVITKSADDDVVSAGDQIGFTITVTNTGVGNAFNVAVNDTLPAGMSWTIDPASAGWSITGGVLRFGPATVAGGTFTSAHIVATTDAADCGLVPNTALLTYTGGSGSDDSSVTVQCPDITISKSADNSPIQAGAVASYTITVINKLGENVGTAHDVTVDDVLPSGISWTDDSADCQIFGGTLECDFGDLEPGESRSVTVSGTTSSADCGNLPNLATTAASNEPDGATGDNSDDATIVVRCPEIGIDKTNDEGLVEPNQTVSYTIDVTVFDGPVTDAVVTDELPVGQTYVAGSQASDPAATFAVSPDGRTLTWTFASLADGAQGAPAAVITYDVTIDADAVAGIQVNVAEICVAELADCESDDEDVEVIVPVFGLVIDKTNDAPPVPLELPDGSIVDLPTAFEGDTVTYTLTYTLLGDPTTDGVIDDVLPAGVTYVDGSATDDAQFTFQSYDDATRTLTWTAATVSENGAVTYQATVDVGAAALVQPLVNVAVIDSDQTEPDDDDSEVFVPAPVAGATGTPRVTLPPTDMLPTAPQAPTNPGYALMVALLAIAAVVLVLGFVTPVPASARERSRR